MAGEPGQLTLSEIAEDETVAGILLFGTAGWCTFCQAEGQWLVAVYDSYQNLPGGRRIEMVAVIFQDETAATATPEYGEAYAARRGFPFPAVVDPQGILLNYFDAAAAPGNIFVRIEPELMVLQQAFGGWDQTQIETNLEALDGPSSCE